MNLVQHRIATVSTGQPLAVDVEFSGFQTARHIQAIAEQILFAIENATIPGLDLAAEKLAKHYERVSKTEGERQDATYSNMFVAFRRLLSPFGIDLVVRISKGGDSDSWVAAYEAVQGLASYVLILTQDQTWAKTCYQQMIIRNYSIAWIRSRKLDLARGLLYVADRVRSERLNHPDGNGEPFAPFTEQAIKALYARGEANRGETVEYPIGWLRLRLNDAFDDKLNDLVSRGTKSDNIDPNLTLIDATTIGRVYARRNLGG
jgi:hypothetical protein